MANKAGGQPPLTRRSRIITFLHICERLALAVGAVCGVVALIWQLRISEAKSHDIIKPKFTIETHDGSKNLILKLTLSNIGERPVFVQSVYVGIDEDVPHEKHLGDTLQLMLLAPEDPKNRPLEIGASRSFVSSPMALKKFQDMVRDHGDNLYLTAITQRGESIVLSEFGDFLRKTIMDVGRTGDQYQIWIYNEPGEP